MVNRRVAGATLTLCVALLVVTASSGRLYIASDSVEFYYGDSGSWVKLNVGSGGTEITVQSGGTAVGDGSYDTLNFTGAGVTPP